MIVRKKEEKYDWLMFEYTFWPKGNSYNAITPFFELWMLGPMMLNGNYRNNELDLTSIKFIK